MGSCTDSGHDPCFERPFPPNREARWENYGRDGPEGKIPVGWHVEYAWPMRRRSTTSSTLRVYVRRKPFRVSPRWLAPTPLACPPAGHPFNRRRGCQRRKIEQRPPYEHRD